MGRTLPSITHVFFKEQKSLSNFRRALSRGDQLILDELFTCAHTHSAPAAYAAHTLPMELFLLAMLMEAHKEVMRLRRMIYVVLGNGLDAST
jgi:hypothetical protein